MNKTITIEYEDETDKFAVQCPYNEKFNAALKAACRGTYFEDGCWLVPATDEFQKELELLLEDHFPGKPVEWE